MSEKQDPISLNTLDRAAHTFPTTVGLGVDRWNPRAFACLDDDGQKALLDLMRMVELHLAWPAQVLLNLVVLLP